MPVTIKQKVKFDLPVARIYRFYTDPKLHTSITGSKTSVSTVSGSAFSAFGGALKGKTLHAKKNQLFVQTWRSASWPKGEKDSILVLTFREKDGGTEVEMVHVNVSDTDADGVKKGWNEYYWKPWKAHIKTLRK